MVGYRPNVLPSRGALISDDTEASQLFEEAAGGFKAAVVLYRSTGSHSYPVFVFFPMKHTCELLVTLPIGRVSALNWLAETYSHGVIIVATQEEQEALTSSNCLSWPIIVAGDQESTRKKVEELLPG